jgi:hypothetical protein
LFHEMDACSADVLAVDAGDAEFSRDPEPTGNLRRMTGSPSRPVRSGCPEQAANLEAYRLREMAGVLIEIADRYLDASVVLMSPAESARIGAASRLAERALRIVNARHSPAWRV